MGYKNKNCILYFLHRLNFLRWQTDPLCDSAFPKSFDEVKRTLNNCRRLKFGNPPRNCEEIQREFQKEELFENLGRSKQRFHGVLFNTVQITDRYENCIFSSPFALELIKENISNVKDRFFVMDATFRVTPQGNFQQLLIIHAFIGKKSFPIVYALMSRKTKEAYFNLLKYVHEELIELNESGIIIDFEKAERGAISELQMGIRIFGCWFHFCQALRRKIASMQELFQLVRTDGMAKHLFLKFQCLALLPSDMIEDAFKELAKRALRDFALFAPFVDYFDREWIKIVTPHHFSVFMRGLRTTGHAETYNCRINQRFKTHGNFFRFCESLQDEEVVIVNHLEGYFQGTIQYEKLPKFYKKRNKLIRKYSLMLQNKEISVQQFLTTMANKKNNVLYADEDISIEEEEVKMNEDVELFGGLDDIVYENIDDWSDEEISSGEESSVESTESHTMPRRGNFHFPI